MLLTCDNGIEEALQTIDSPPATLTSNEINNGTCLRYTSDRYVHGHTVVRQCNQSLNTDESFHGSLATYQSGGTATQLLAESTTFPFSRPNDDNVQDWRWMSWASNKVRLRYPNAGLYQEDMYKDVCLERIEIYQNGQMVELLNGTRVWFSYNCEMRSALQNDGSLCQSFGQELEIECQQVYRVLQNNGFLYEK